ncbi:lysophospholipid acyltransferase family protein [Paenibacillus sp. IB182496]|uniref:Lysophospholipid acyltransferase family protein n=1 Tax=Paenibacillus sabuli TaxID=2772509 RepID=A0A927BWP1_9BACL|nr:lysophospholipid acyltransferase family protein [Paenibacillus sabuli]MBD2848232.1 lysophospholipid acyltransferase family protein [Paenibacillus sabuli]
MSRLVNPSPLFSRVFARYNERCLLRRHFHTVGLRGTLDPAPQGQPVLYVMNHSSWWDGLVLYQAFRRASTRRHYVLMDEAQLARYRFFGRLGAIPIDRASARASLRSLDAAAELLREGSGVWLFPQGEIRHLEERPLAFRTGAGYLMERCPTVLVQPATIYYSHGLHQKADVSLWLGEPLYGDWPQLGRKPAAQRIQDILEAQLDAHRAQVVAAAGGPPAHFNPLLAPGRSTSEAFDAFKKGVARWSSFFGR